MLRSLARATSSRRRRRFLLAGAASPAAGRRAFATESLTRQHSTRQRPPSPTSSKGGAAADGADGADQSASDDTMPSRTTVSFSTVNRPGALEEALRVFWKHDINMTRIVSEPSLKSPQDYEFTIDFDGRAAEERTQSLLTDLRASCHEVEMLEAKKVPWFPTSLNDLDFCVQQTLDAGGDLESDHPGFNDEAYRERRKEIADWAYSFSFGDPIPRINYTDTEVKTWGSVLSKLRGMFNRYACKEYLEIFPLIERECGARVDNIPQICDISDFLRETTGFQMRPVAGLLSARNFLNGLAFKTFFSTQYIRHHSMPLYTPEPDLCHELLRHAPMFADPDFAEFSHRIGLAVRWRAFVFFFSNAIRVSFSFSLSLFFPPHSKTHPVLPLFSHSIFFFVFIQPWNQRENNGKKNPKQRKQKKTPTVIGCV